MAYGLKVIARDGSIVQIDSDDNGIHPSVGAYVTSASNIIVKNDDWVYPGFDIFAKRVPASGQWKSLFVEYVRSPQWEATTLGSFGYSPVFDGGSGGNVNLTNDSISLSGSSSNQNAYVLMKNGDLVKYVYLGSGSSIGGLTSGDLYYVRDKGTYGSYAFRLGHLSTGNLVNLTSYSTDTSNTGNKFDAGGYELLFRGNQGYGTPPTTATYFTGGIISDVTYFISANQGLTSYTENLTGNYGLQINNSLNDVVFDSRAFGSNTALTPSVVLQSATRSGDPTSATPITSDYTLIPRVYTTGTIGFAYSSISYAVYGYLFYRNNTYLGGSGIKWIGQAGSFGNPAFVDNIFGCFLVEDVNP